MSKLLLVTYYWPPGGGAGVQRSLKFAKYLPAFGIMPVVLTVDENKAFYPFLDRSLLKDISPELRVVKTQKTELLRRFSNLFPKVEVPQAGFAGNDKQSAGSKIKRFVRGNLFIPDARAGWVKPAYHEAVRLLEEEGIDTYQISSPPHSSQLLGLKLKKRFPHKKWIADLRDPWTDIYFYKDLLHTPLAKAIDARYERRVLEQADEIIVVSESIKRLFAAKLPGIESKIHVIPNGYDADDFRLPSHPPQDEFLVTYTGTLADSYEPEIIFEALRDLAAEEGAHFPVRLLFVGKLPDSVKQQAQAYGMEQRIRHVDYVPHEEAVKYLLDTTALLLVIPRTAEEKGILTGKLFEYLAARKPIIAIGPPDGDAARIIAECEAGQTFSRDQKAELTDYLRAKINRWRQNPDLDLAGNRAGRYAREQLTGELARIIQTGHR